jgi:hypothetical protein
LAWRSSSGTSYLPIPTKYPAGGRRGSSRREFLGGVHGLARQITLLYDRLIRIQPSPVVELNRAVAIAMYKGPEQGLYLIDDLLTREELDNYSLAYSAPCGSVSQAGAASGGPCFL